MSITDLPPAEAKPRPRRWPFRLPAGDLFEKVVYRRLWTSVLITSFGSQITILAIPLMAAILLHATPTQMGRLTAVELLPYLLFSLPAGVWLDRVDKRAVCLGALFVTMVSVSCVPAVWRLGFLSIGWLYALGFLIGSVGSVAGSAAQIVLTEVVPRERLVDAHSRNALAYSGAEIAGPAIAGALVRAFGAPLTLLVDSMMLAVAAMLFSGVKIQQPGVPSDVPSMSGGASPSGAKPRRHFAAELWAGLQFVRGHALLPWLAICVGLWQAANQAATSVQILFATRVLGLNEQAVGLSYAGVGVGTVLASAFGSRISRALGPGRALASGLAVTAASWALMSVAPAGVVGIVDFVVMRATAGFGAMIVLINFLALRQSVTPTPMLGRMTATMRWLILLPAVPGALVGGSIGQHLGLRTALLAAALLAATTAIAAIWVPAVRRVRILPSAT